MRYPADHKQKSRERLLTESGKAFRRQGYGMIGVDGLAKSANLTSGAFYVHFDSKKQAFLEVLGSGLEQLRDGVAQTRDCAGDDWLDTFARFYLGEKRVCELGEACALPMLSAEAERAGDDARSVFEQKIREINAEVAKGLEGSPKQRTRQAWVELALLLGGASLSRTVLDPKLSKEIATAVIAAIPKQNGEEK